MTDLPPDAWYQVVSEHATKVGEEAGCACFEGVLDILHLVIAYFEACEDGFDTFSAQRFHRVLPLGPDVHSPEDWNRRSIEQPVEQMPSFWGFLLLFAGAEVWGRCVGCHQLPVLLSY
jgi:hypothetical protein